MPSPTPLLAPKTFRISGIEVDIFGLDNLPSSCESVSCLWLLHGRLQSRDAMAATASTCIRHWNERRASSSSSSSPSACTTRGLVCVSFDQRNHGTRSVGALANQAWKENELHALDMYTIFQGTSVDISFLIDHLGSYAFPQENAPAIDQHLVMGVSLGGHVAWQALFNDPRITAAVVVIGCPDYMYLMSDRARLSKRKSYLDSNGARFFGSRDFPPSLIASVIQRDPKGLLFGTGDITQTPSAIEQKHLRGILDARIRGKRVLVCSGAIDKLVPYRCSEPFLKFIKEASQTWYRDGDFQVEDVVYPGVGHEYTEEMVDATAKFVSDALADPGSRVAQKASKI